MREHEAAARRMIVGGAIVLAAALAALGVAAAALIRADERTSREGAEGQIAAAIDELWDSLAQPPANGAEPATELTRDLAAKFEPRPFDPLPEVADAEARFYLHEAETGDPHDVRTAALLALESQDPVARLLAARFLYAAMERQRATGATRLVDWPDPRVPASLDGTREAVAYHVATLSHQSAALPRLYAALGTEDDECAAAVALQLGRAGSEAIRRFRANTCNVRELLPGVRAAHGRRVGGREIRVRLLPDGDAAVAWTTADGWLLRRVDAATVADLEARVLAPVGVRIVRAADVVPGAAAQQLDDGVATKSAPAEPARSGLLIGGTAVAALAAVVAFAAFARGVRRSARAQAARSDFVATVSHELRTPVAVVRTAAETLLAGRATREEDRAQLVGAILRESERLSGLVGNVLDFSRIDAGTRRYAFRETSVEDLIEETVRRVDPVLRATGFRVDVEIPDPLPRLACDADALSAALSNLLDNAAKFRGTSDTATVRAVSEAGGVRIDVIDHGVGIPDAEKPHAGERFFRGADPRVRETRGSGIGLSLVRHALEAHGGRMTIGDTPGGGTTVSLHLPGTEGSSRCSGR